MLPRAVLPVAVALALTGAGAAAAPARADLTSLKAACAVRDAADGDSADGIELPYRFCDDGVPPTGGTTPNPGAQLAIAVPQRYEGVEGLPPKAPAEPGSGADAEGNIALDADVTLPDPGRHPPPAAGYPLVVMMHGCCSGNKTSSEATTVDARGEAWHYSNAWFAARGYAVLTYTARGFVSSDASGRRGSTGQTQIDDARYEVNDLQHLVGQLVDDPFFAIDPTNVVVTGGSYGGGLSWMALTDPTWASPGGRAVRLRAVAPKYGWTDLVYSLVPTGHHLRDRLPAFDGSDSAQPLGIPKRSIVAALYASGKTGVPPGTGSHATFPPSIDSAFACFQSSDPYPANPLCQPALGQTLPEFIRFRSAYYQDRFWQRLAAGDAAARVPVFSAGTLTDPLFTPVEHRRMVDRLRAVDPTYPVREYYGDYQHFVQNKAKEWGDVCGEDRHVCRLEDHPGGDLDAAPPTRKRIGATTLLNGFLDHYARPPGNADEPPPAFEVTASLQICPQNAASAGLPADEPGERFTAATFDALAPGRLTLDLEGVRATTHRVEPNPHARTSDPVANLASNGGRCPVERAPAGPGVAVYESAPLDADATMLGRTRVRATHSGSGTYVQLNARLYDVFPDGTAVMVDRGAYRVPEAGVAGTSVYDLHGNGWRFPAGHRVRIELAQDDDPYLRASSQPSALTITRVRLEIPTREGAREAARCEDTSGFRAVAARPRGRGLVFRFSRHRRTPVGVDVFQQSVGRRIIGNRLVARFRGRRGSFGWNGRGTRARVRDGHFVVRMRTPRRAGGTETRRVAVVRRNGRFRSRPAFSRAADCGDLRLLKLEHPVLGGLHNRAVSLSYRLAEDARVTLEVRRAGRLVRRLRARSVRAGRQVRVRLASERLPRGDLQVRLVGRTAAGARISATVVAARL